MLKKYKILIKDLDDNLLLEKTFEDENIVFANHAFANDEVANNFEFSLNYSTENIEKSYDELYGIFKSLDYFINNLHHKNLKIEVYYFYQSLETFVSIFKDIVKDVSFSTTFDDNVNLNSDMVLLRTTLIFGTLSPSGSMS